MHQLCQIRTRVFISTMMPLVKMGCVLMQEEKVVPCLLNQLRKRELNYLTCYLDLSIVKHGSKSDIQEDHKNIQDIFTKLVLSLCYPRWNEIGYDLEQCYHLEKKSQPMPLATKNCAKKVRVTLRIKSCIPSSSNLTRIIIVLKIGGRFSLGPRT